MSILPFVIPLFCIMSIAAFYAVYFKRHLSETFFLSAVTIIIILYAFGLLNIKGSLLAGYIFIIVVSILSVFYLFKVYAKNNKSLESISYKSGILLILVFMGLSMLINYGRVFIHWDEFSHWGTVVKHMYIFDALGTITGSSLLGKSYIPGTALFQYFWARPFPQFTEYTTYLASNLLIASIIMIFFNKNLNGLNKITNASEKNSKKENTAVSTYLEQFNLKMMIIVLSLLLVPLAMNRDIYNTLYVDGFMGLLFGTVILLYYYYGYERSSFGILMVTAAAGMLTLTKHMGFLLSAIAVTIIAIDIILFRRVAVKNYIFSSNNQRKWIKLFLLASPVLIILFFRLSWSALLSAANISEIFSLSFDNLVNFLRGDLLPYQKIVITNFLSALRTYPYWPLKYTHVNFLVTLTVVAVSLSLWLKIYQQKMIRPLTIYSILMLSSLGYAAFLMFTYMYGFSEWEAVRLASYGRYMSSHLIGLILALLMFIIELPPNAFYIKKSSNLAIRLYPMVIILLVAGSIIYGAGIKRADALATIPARQYYNKVLAWSDLILDNSDQRIGVITQKSKGYEKWVLDFIIYPNKFATPWKGYSFAVEPYYSENDPWTYIIEPEDFGQHILDRYDFLYLFRYDDLFQETYGYYFDQLTTGMIYEVTVDSEGSLLLIAVGK